MKFVCLFAASLIMSSAFAQTKNNITFDVGDIVNQEGNFNTNFVVGSYKDHSDKEGDNKSLLLNYSREVVSQLQLRFILGYAGSEELFDTTNDSYEEVETLTYGLGLIYNFSDDLTNSWFAGVTYINQKIDYLKEDTPALNQDIDETGNVTTFILEAGKRYKLGSISSMTFTWSPSITYSMTKYDEEIAGSFTSIGAGSPDKVNDLRVNLLKLDAFF